MSGQNYASSDTHVGDIRCNFVCSCCHVDIKASGRPRLESPDFASLVLVLAFCLFSQTFRGINLILVVCSQQCWEVVCACSGLLSVPGCCDTADGDNSSGRSVSSSVVTVQIPVFVSKAMSNSRLFFFRGNNANLLESGAKF